MMNMSIECDVKSCKYNHENERYCTLGHIKVTSGTQHQGNHEADCASYKEK